jgi:hypothetical protein
MIEIKKRASRLDAAWKKWAFAGFLAAGVIAGVHKMMRRTGQERTASAQAEEPPRKYDRTYQGVSEWQGIHAAEANLKERQRRYQRRIEKATQAQGKSPQSTVHEPPGNQLFFPTVDREPDAEAMRERADASRP